MGMGITWHKTVFPGCEHLLTITHRNGVAIEPDAADSCEPEFTPGM